MTDALKPDSGETAFTVPSGQDVTLFETRLDADGPAGRTLRLSFVAPAIARDGGTVGFDAAARDMAHLCQTVALPRLRDQGADQVVIALSPLAKQRPRPPSSSKPSAPSGAPVSGRPSDGGTKCGPWRRNPAHLCDFHVTKTWDCQLCACIWWWLG